MSTDLDTAACGSTPKSPSFPNGASGNRSEAEVRRSRAIQNIRDACQRDGLSSAMTEECVSSLESAFAVKDMMASLFGGVR